MGAWPDGQRSIFLEVITIDSLKDRVNNAKYVYYSISGGRDSAAAMYLTVDEFRRQGKTIAAIFVDNGDELPGVAEHAEYLCQEMGVPLIRLQGNGLYEVYGPKGKWPDAIHMDCIEALINKPMDTYLKDKHKDEDYVLIRGGRASQKRPESGTKVYQAVKSKPRMIIYNPLFELSTEDCPQWLEWDGYAKGFVRTACWCCPFQRPEQYAALKSNYPELHERLKYMFESLTFIVHPGDGHVKYLADYWLKREYTPLKLDYAPSRKIKCK